MDGRFAIVYESYKPVPIGKDMGINKMEKVCEVFYGTVAEFEDFTKDMGYNIVQCDKLI